MEDISTWIDLRETNNEKSVGDLVVLEDAPKRLPFILAAATVYILPRVHITTFEDGKATPPIFCGETPTRMLFNDFLMRLVHVEPSMQTPSANKAPFISVVALLIYIPKSFTRREKIECSALYNS